MAKTLTEIKEILEEYNINPKRSLGQNFLIDQNILKKIIKESNVSKEDKVLEIGPGLGIITQELDQITNLIAVEKDTTFVKILNNSNLKNTTIIEADILEYIKKNSIKEFKIIANIPYYLTSFLIRNLLENENQPKEIYLIIQKEVAERICSKKMNQLALSVQYYGKPKKLFNISKNSFWPIPKVESALIRIIPERKYEKDDVKFFKLMKAGFSSPRKKVINNLMSILKKEDLNHIFEKHNISLTARAESLSIQDWENLKKEI